MLVDAAGIKKKPGSPSQYVRSRGEGEAAVQTAFPGAVIIRPAVIFAPCDVLLTTIGGLLRSLPAYPIFSEGSPRLQPAAAEDVAAAIAGFVRQCNKPYPIFHRVGQRVYSYGVLFLFFPAKAGIRADLVTGVQTCALPI